MTQSPRALFLYPTRSRLKRLDGVPTGETPKEFYYGYLGLRDRGFNVTMVDSWTDPKSLLGRIKLELDVRISGITNLGLAPQRIAAISSEFGTTDIALSFTDSFSLSMGLYRHKLPQRPYLVGGFHGLADFPDRTPSWLRSYAVRKIRKALAGLDHIFFFGEADRLESIRRYGLRPEKTSLFLFGVDTDFWHPGTTSLDKASFVLSVGSDPKRDYETLISAEIDAPIKIITNLPISVPPSAQNIELIRGSYHHAKIDDLLLRDIYRASEVVVVPIRDFYQPSGYSVTLQAMACGKPVVLSRIKGLWDPNVFKSGVNCILVEPGDPMALCEATSRLLADQNLRNSIGRAARETAVRQFSLNRMDERLAHMIATFSRIHAGSGITDP